ncbi:MAG: phytoene desaturase [Spartobacteria bacterium]|nr:phytoene desaturase [Spartobacteria bacterium]
MSAKKKIIVIGSGLGGISAAITLAQEGYEVSVYEKNDRIGGKLNVLTTQGYTFDMGPSILTLPHIFERLFTRSGKKMADYIPIRTLQPHWRNFFDDGTVVNLFMEKERMAAEAEKLEPGAARQVEAFMKYAETQYDLVEKGYFEAGLDTAREFMAFYSGSAFFQFDFWHTMHQGVAKRISNRYLRDIFDFFIKYVGSSAYDAPGFMNCLPVIQFRHDLWYVDGGLYGIARGLGRLMEELGVEVHLNAEVMAIRKKGDQVTGITLKDGSALNADIIVSNMEVIPAYETLLKEDAAFMRKLERFEPACSGLVLDLGLDCKYDQLAHHNFFFSSDQKKHFKSVFRDKVLPHNPTIYLVAASRTDPTVAPAGCECLKILPHIPYINDRRPYTREDYLRFKEHIIDRLESMGLKDLRRHVVFEHVWTPLDIRQQYYSNKGSIYGVVSDRIKNFAFKAPKHSTRYDNLFFTGGSVNPGGGMPMVVLCGQNVCKRIVEWDRN